MEPNFQKEKGIVVQTFGQYFASLIDLNLEEWYKVHMDFAEDPFQIKGVSPFSIIGNPDPVMQKYAECKNTNTRVKADVRKNFSEICRKAYCDYLVLDNTSTLIDLIEINGQLYSIMAGEKTDFIDEFYNRNEEAKTNLICPSKEGLSQRLKSQYDLFIETILCHYDPDHIIMIRSHVPHFYFQDGDIAKTVHTEEARNLLQQLDNYFLEKTNCISINTPSQFFETHKNPIDHIFSKKQWELQIALERDIVNAIEQSTQKDYFSHKKLSSKNNTLMTFDFPSNSIKSTSENLIVQNHSYHTKTIADYIVGGGTDISIISNYFQSIPYTYEDIIALCFLWNSVEDIFQMDVNLAEKILDNKNGSPYLHTKRLFEHNVRVLREYEYCFIALDDISFEDTIIVKLGSKQFLEITRHDVLRFVSDQSWDYKRFIDNGYTCGMADIDEALGSFETYFERGRRKCVDPFVLAFATKSDFMQSLYFLDYEDILDNENYIIALSGSDIGNINYKPKLDTTFLFDEKTRIGSIAGVGMGDQIGSIEFYKSVCDANNLELWIQDLAYDQHFVHAGMDSCRICDPSIDARRFTKIFSKRLRWMMRMATSPEESYPVNQNTKWSSLGLQEAYNIVWGLHFMPDLLYKFVTGPENITPVFACKTPKVLEDFFINKIPNKPVIACSVYMGVPDLKLKKSVYEKYFNFPEIPIEDTLNHTTMSLCQSTYSIAIHLRRGDYIVGTMKKEWHSNVKYKESLKMVYDQLSSDRYPNKHLFVFSDDMEFVKANTLALGLDIAGDSITYVDWNHHFNSFRDMQLMASCRIIIRSLGVFGYTAASIGKSVDCLISVNDQGGWIEWIRESL